MPRKNLLRRENSNTTQSPINENTFTATTLTTLQKHLPPRNVNATTGVPLPFDDNDDDNDHVLTS